MTTVVTWNCNMAFRNKKDRILEYDPDILVIQECESPAVNGTWSEFSDWLWIGENQHKGLGVFARNGFSLRPGDISGVGGRFSLPVATDAAIDVLGVWAMDDTENLAQRYIGQVFATVRDYADWIDADTVVLGDFNWNMIWDDSPRGPLLGDFSDTIRMLNECGLQSVYHTVTGSEFGEEDAATFYLHKTLEKEYHLDYIFAGGDVSDVWIGEFEDWIDVSDHMPVILEI